MLGLSLHGWENSMVIFLIIAGGLGVICRHWSNSRYLAIFGLLHSQCAFGMDLPLLASDRRQPGRGRSSVVEPDLVKVGVEGSSPFARFNFFRRYRSLTKARRRAGFS